MQRERKVKLKYPENDNFIELWAEIGHPRKYVGRYTAFGQGSWVKICDPLGYCEMDYTFGPEEVFIVCDQKGNELFRSRNGDGSANFNTLEKEAHEQFAAYMQESGLSVKVENTHAMFLAHAFTGNPVGGLNEWLMSFQDPDLYQKANDYPENWVYFDIDEVGDAVVLKTYEFLGEKWKIEKQHFKHRYCDAEWDVLYSGGYYIGDLFDASIQGTMYSKNQARSILTKAIKANHPGSYNVSIVKEYRPYADGKPTYKEARYNIEHAWEYLSGGNLHKSHIDKIAAEEADKSHFFADWWSIKELYPDCIRDWSF